MKKPINKKAQVYGLSSFIYALAIAVILLIGLIGMSKDFETKSQAASYRYGATLVTRNAETIKKVIEEERNYALDKSVFVAGTSGGVRETVLTPWACGSKINQSITYLPEYGITYWQKYGKTCIPTDQQTIDSILYYAENVFSKPDQTIITALSNAAGKDYNFDYVMKVVNYSKTMFEVNWFAKGTVTEDGVTTPLEKISFTYPPGDETIEYSFDPFVHTNSETTIFKIKSEAETFVQNKNLEAWLSSGSVFPTVIDKDRITGKVTLGMSCTRPATCGDVCVYATTDSNCVGTTIGNTKCEDVGCKTTCWVASGKNVDSNNPWVSGCSSSTGDTCVGASNSLTDKPSALTCGDYCVSTNSVKCNGATVTNIGNDCTAVGCKTSCWGALKNDCPGDGDLNLDRCVGDTNSLTDTPDFSKITSEANCKTAKGVWANSPSTHDCTTDPDNPAYCTQKITDLKQSFKTLVDYAKALPNTPNVCSLDNSINIADSYDYPGTCTIYTVRNATTGKLVVDASAGTSGFSGTCTSDGSVHAQLMKCVMMRVINKMDAQIPGTNPGFSSELDWKIEFYRFNLTYAGVKSTYTEYNTSDGPFISCAAGTPLVKECGEYCLTCSGTHSIGVTSTQTLTFNKNLHVTSCSAVGCSAFTPEPEFDTDRCVGTTSGRMGFADKQASQCSAITDLESCINAGCKPIKG